MTDRELMQQALDALINAKGYIFHNVLDDKANQYDTAVEALRARLAQPEPEPVAWHEPGAYGNVTVHEKWANENGWLPFYATPPQREWQGLTDKDCEEVERWVEFKEEGSGRIPTLKLIRYTEAKLKEKNAPDL